MEPIPGVPTFKKDGKLHVPSFTAGPAGRVRLSHAGKTYEGDVSVRFTGELRVTYQGLSLAEAGDVLAISGAAEKIAQTFQGAGLSLTIFEVTPPASVKTSNQLDTFYLEQLLLVHANIPNALARLAAKRPEDQQKEVGYTVTSRTVPLTISPEATQASLAVARANVLNLIGNPKAANGSILLVDEPCLQFSLAPTLSGTDSVATAATFRARYDFLDAHNKTFLKLRAEGQGATQGTYYDRLEADAFFGINRTVARVVLGLGGSGSYALSRENNEKRDQWTVVTKLQANLPNMTGILGALPGAGTSPILNLELGAVGKDNGTVTTREFLARANALFTARVTTRLSLDLQGSAGWSSEPLYADSESFRYGKFEVRFNLSKDWDYLVRYECGRKPPEYQNFCGSQSGFAMVAGR
jgi:hypothetical protein